MCKKPTGMSLREPPTQAPKLVIYSTVEDPNQLLDVKLCCYTVTALPKSGAQFTIPLILLAVTELCST